METLINDLRCQNVDGISKCLDSFCKAHARTMKFPELNEKCLRNEIWGLLFEKLSDEKYSSIHEKCLETMRILSRDGTDLDNIITDERLNIVINEANLNAPNTSYTNVTLEALKLICNLIFNSKSVQTRIVKTVWLSNLVERISAYDDSTLHGIKLFDVRILFLVTAFNTTSRKSLKYELNADNYLINMLDKLTKHQGENNLEKENIEIICEILKTLFNLYIEWDDSTDDEKEKHRRLADITYRFLIGSHFQEQEELHNHVINLLTVIPSNGYSQLIKTVTTCAIEQENREIYNSMDMSAISELLKFLDRRLCNQSNIAENVMPVLTVLLKLSSHDRLIRKYCRQRVLPPLKDVMKRPEEGTTLRAKLCKLLVSPSTELKNIVAEFLFILCKENVGRMIKYTGYGNAAGMFADKGLLGCKQPQTDYSSDSGESDTEEYTKYKEDINPVTGCYEKPKPNPLEGMTEEQKEYEAMELVALVNQLTNDGVVRPCTVGEDGKPKPIKHILELQDSSLRGLQTNRDSDSE